MQVILEENIHVLNPHQSMSMIDRRPSPSAASSENQLHGPNNKSMSLHKAPSQEEK